MVYLDLKGIYEGFVRSYCSLCLPSEAENLTQTTQAVLSYFRNLCLMLGYFPYSEEDLVDLGWYNYKDEPILHLEHENYTEKAKETIDKLFRQLKKGYPCFSIAIIWVKSENMAEEIFNYTLGKIKKKPYPNLNHVLVILKIEERQKNKNSDIETYPIKATLYDVNKKSSEPLAEARLIYDKKGWQRMYFPDEDFW